MDVFIVRTRLQALIAARLVADGHASRSYAVAFVYRDRIGEDAASAGDAYAALEKGARFAWHIASNPSFAGITARFTWLFLQAGLTAGRVFFAGVDSYPTAIAARLVPFARLCTFDDGSANIFNNSKYFWDSSAPGKGLRRTVLRALFPRGSAFYLRRRSRAHFTIFPGLPNIVERARIVDLHWQWDHLLAPEDLPKLPGGKGPLAVTLGIANKNRDKLEDLLAKSDLYILHPREPDWTDSRKTVRLKSPAEAALIHLARDRPVSVWHFNSTVSYTLAGRPNITFINVLGT